MQSLAKQVKSESKKPIRLRLKEEENEDGGSYKGNLGLITSTGSTWLDLAISGSVTKKGGLPAGILVEAFGPNSSGKTVLLMEIAGAVQRAGGETYFNDPEARLNQLFAKLFDFDVSKATKDEPDTVTKVFRNLLEWKPKNLDIVNGFFTDSLAALSTDLEMENTDGDKMGMKRAKEFSEGLRKSCRVIKQNNYIMVCSNQIRDNASGQGETITVPGGKGVGFYSSVRLRFFSPEKIKSKKKKIGKKEEDRVIGTKVKVEVYKNSCDVSFRSAYLYLINGYGIDDIRANLQYVKDYTNNSVYCVGETKLSNELEEAIKMVEEQGLEKKLKREMIALWHSIEAKFRTSRKRKER